MTHWTPLQEHQEIWMPVGGWNASFSEMDRIQGSTLFAFFTKKGCRASVASSLVHMVIYKQKYHALRYSEEQESLLKQMMQPIIH
jgi:hypothetical protein